MFHNGFKGAISGLSQFVSTESALKVMKNAFYLNTLKALSFSRYLKFCLDFLVMCKNGLIGKIRPISNFVTSLTGKQTIALHTLSNISRSKCSQARKLGQLIEYVMRNIFLENIIHKMWCRNYSTTLFWKIKIEHIFVNQ